MDDVRFVRIAGARFYHRGDVERARGVAGLVARADAGARVVAGTLTCQRCGGDRFDWTRTYCLCGMRLPPDTIAALDRDAEAQRDATRGFPTCSPWMFTVDVAEALDVKIADVKNAIAQRDALPSGHWAHALVWIEVSRHRTRLFEPASVARAAARGDG